MAACLAVLLVVLIGAWPALVSMIRYQTTGVFETSSSDLDAEVEMFAQRLKLKPGMTLCEMGSANGALMSRLAPRVMPGGKLVATSPVRQELAATADAVDRAGVDADSTLTTYHATDDHWAPGLPDGSCDALYSRMVIHMLPDDTFQERYIGQWARALKPGARMCMADHNPLVPHVTTGPKRPLVAFFGGKIKLVGMDVWPEETEVALITRDHFDLIAGPFAVKYFEGGYGAVYSPRKG